MSFSSFAAALGVGGGATAPAPAAAGGLTSYTPAPLSAVGGYGADPPRCTTGVPASAQVAAAAPRPSPYASAASTLSSSRPPRQPDLTSPPGSVLSAAMARSQAVADSLTREMAAARSRLADESDAVAARLAALQRVVRAT